MLSMPRYWNSEYFDKETKTLSKSAPEELRKESESTISNTDSKDGKVIKY